MIEHKGVVKKIDGDRITVTILQRSACSSCHAKSRCMLSDTREIDLKVKGSSEDFCENEKVIVEGESSVGYKAFLWAFLIPLLIMVTTVILTSTLLNCSEIRVAILSIAATVPYYILLYLFRNRMGSSLRFSIKKENRI